jgi:hypothetical protein
VTAVLKPAQEKIRLNIHIKVKNSTINTKHRKYNYTYYQNIQTIVKKHIHTYTTKTYYGSMVFLYYTKVFLLLIFLLITIT